MPTLELPAAPVAAPPPPHDPSRPMPLAPLAGRPLVSVLVANYNYARFLPAALESLVAQSYPHWEAVVCDDGSTDDSAVGRRDLRPNATVASAWSARPTAGRTRR